MSTPTRQPVSAGIHRLRWRSTLYPCGCRTRRDTTRPHAVSVDCCPNHAELVNGLTRQGAST